MHPRLVTLFGFCFVVLCMLSGRAQAQGYAHSLFLCDLSIQSLTAANNLGVNYVTYEHLGQSKSIAAVSTLQKASQKVPEGTNLWAEANQITSVLFNLESDYYGTEYSWDYCYIWNRDQLNETLFAIDINVATPPEMDNTLINFKTECTSRSILNTLNTQTSFNTRSTLWNMPSNQVELKCIIRFTFREENFSVRRPHQTRIDNLTSQIGITVDP
ncbi:MAG: hypothetical protein A2X86_21415 [Bdellovibrionales bacterium GWA2_49_15]|nr:MAG: hypothetical protein A2X86_21415 [Bdellovibrionales bacterium GWA2_49_15]HAZ14939.1 hypothetical protein [Bdellovibrionales bacterium]